MYSTVVTDVCYWLTRNRLLHQAHLMSTLRQIFINNCLLGEGVMATKNNAYMLVSKIKFIRELCELFNT